MHRARKVYEAALSLCWSWSVQWNQKLRLGTVLKSRIGYRWLIAEVKAVRLQIETREKEQVISDLSEQLASMEQTMAEANKSAERMQRMLDGAFE